MKIITIFGASGGTGQALTTEAREQGLETRAFNKKNPSPEDLRQAIIGADAVVIVFGPRPPYTDIFCAAETEKIVRAMEDTGVKRLICQTGAMIGNYPLNRSFLFKIFSNQFKKNNPRGYADRVAQEEAVKQSVLDWTVIKPPRLTEKTTDKTVSSGEKLKVGLLSSVSRKSLAKFIVNELLTPHHLRQVVFVKN